MENRTVEDYSIDVTLSAPAMAYLFLDNRLNGNADNNSNPNSQDPILTNELAWVINDGWARVNTGFMPNGQADYIGVDEGGTVASADLRTHHDPGSGVALNQFSAIFTKTFAAGTHVGMGKKYGITNTNLYGIAFAPSGPPPIDGDTDGDGVVELEDFNPIRDNFRKSVSGRSLGDIATNGVVDFADFRQWKNAFMGGGGSLVGLDLGPVAEVPEPTSAVLFCVAIGCFGEALVRRARFDRSITRNGSTN